MIRTARIIETGNLTFPQFKVEGDHATALVTLEVSAVNLQNNKPALGLGKRSQKISFIKEAGSGKARAIFRPKQNLRLAWPPSTAMKNAELCSLRPIVN